MKYHSGYDDCEPRGGHPLQRIVGAQFAVLGVATNAVFSGIRSVLSYRPQSKDSYDSCHAACYDKDCCEVPEPCWMPVSLGEVCCTLCPKNTGEVKFVLTNEDYQSRTYNLESAGPYTGLVTFSQTQLTLGPKERVIITAHFTAPALRAGSKRDEYDLLLWVRGCGNYYLRWKIAVGKKRYHPPLCGCWCCNGHDCCSHRIAVSDKPDYEVHWYDHFYCQRGCFNHSK